jgi:hypothetical protein
MSILSDRLQAIVDSAAYIERTVAEQKIIDDRRDVDFNKKTQFVDDVADKIHNMIMGGVIPRILIKGSDLAAWANGDTLNCGNGDQRERVTLYWDLWFNMVETFKEMGVHVILKKETLWQNGNDFERMFITVKLPKETI